MTSAARGDDPVSPLPRGRLQQSVCKWCYPKSSLEDLCVAGIRVREPMTSLAETVSLRVV